MRRIKTIVGTATLLTLAFMSVGQRAAAQSRIFTAPSTDVVAEKRTVVKFAFGSRLEEHKDGGFETYSPSAVYGVRRGVEVGLNVKFADKYKPNQTVEFQPNAKWQFYHDEDKGVAAAAGATLFLPVFNRAKSDTFGMLYTTVSKKVKAAHGAKFTGGAYGLVGRADGDGPKGGAILSYYQPLLKKVGFAADWMSGHNRFGALTPGFTFKLSKKSTLYTGYSISNKGHKNHGLYVNYGVTF